MIPLGYTLTYVGGRPYTEVTINGIRHGFARGMAKDTIPSDWIETYILPSLEQGVTMWQVDKIGVKPDQTEAMKAVVEEPTVVEEPVAEEPAAEDEPEVTVELSTLTRAELMALCRKNGIKTKNSDKKADLIAKLSE